MNITAVEIKLLDVALKTCVFGKIFEIGKSALSGIYVFEYPGAVAYCRIQSKLALEIENVGA